MSEFLSETFHFLVVKFSAYVYLNRLVFVMSKYHRVYANMGFWIYLLLSIRMLHTVRKCWTAKASSARVSV